MTENYQIVPWTGGRYKAMANGKLIDKTTNQEVLPYNEIGSVHIYNQCGQKISPRLQDLLAHAWISTYNSGSQTIIVPDGKAMIPVNMRVKNLKDSRRPDVLENNWMAEKYVSKHANDEFVEIWTIPKYSYRIYPDDTVIRVRLEDQYKTLNYYSVDPWNSKATFLLNRFEYKANHQRIRARRVIDIDRFQPGSFYRFALSGELEKILRQADGSKYLRVAYPTAGHAKQADPVVHYQKHETIKEEVEQAMPEQKHLNIPHDKVLTITKADGAKVEVANLSMTELESLLKQLA